MVVEPLYLDSGNTRLKWSFGANFGVFQGYEDLFAFIGAHRIDQIVMSTVTNEDLSSAIAKRAPGIKLHLIAVQDDYLGLSLAYSDVSKLGVDRWLNMLAVAGTPAERINVVVSAGTAMTVDVIDDRQHHLGGYIVPGLVTQARSLNQHTQALPMASFSKGTDLGLNTLECIGHGILMSACALVEKVMMTYGSGSASLVITGGDGLYLSESLPVQHIYSEDLIFKGMRAYWYAHGQNIR